MSETVLLSTVVVVQFTVLAGLVLYIAQRIERRIDSLEARMYAEFEKIDKRFERVDARFERMEARFERMEERMRALELGQAKIVGRLFGDDPNEFGLTSGDAGVPLSGAAASAP